MCEDPCDSKDQFTRAYRPLPCPQATFSPLDTASQSRLHFHPVGLTAGASTPGWRQRATAIPTARAAASEDMHVKEGPTAAFVSLDDAISTYAKGGRVDVVKMDCEVRMRADRSMQCIWAVLYVHVHMHAA